MQRGTSQCENCVLTTLAPCINIIRDFLPHFLICTGHNTPQADSFPGEYCAFFEINAWMLLKLGFSGLNVISGSVKSGLELTYVQIAKMMTKRFVF